MTSLTTEELTALTKSVNERLAEFGPDMLGCLSVGVVRLVAEVFVEWQGEAERAFYDALNRQAPSELVPHSNGTLPLLTKGDALDKVEIDELDDLDEIDDLDDDGPPTHKTSDARRAQVAELRRQQRHRKVEYERKADAGRYGNVLPTLDDIIAELRRLSSGTGVMPTIATFDAARPGNWATAGAHMQRLNMSWIDLANEAELRPRQPGRQSA